MAQCAPSGELFATAPQLARLEEIISQQQIQIQRLEQERALFSQGYQSFLEEQVIKAQNTRGTKGNDITMTMKFVSTQVAAAVAQLQESNTDFLKTSIPLRKLQQLETRLLERPGSNQDVIALTERLCHLEARMGAVPMPAPVLGQQENKLSSISSEEVQAIRDKLECLEENLSLEIQRAYKLASKPGDYGTPLGKLQTQVDILTQDVRRLVSADSRQFVESQIQAAATSLKTKFSEEFEKCASLETQNRLEQDTRKIEQFIREIQLSFITSRTKQEDFQDAIAHQFSDERWNKMEQGLNRRMVETIRSQSELFTNLVNEQKEHIQTIIVQAQQTVSTLDRQLRLLYGPETLENHIHAVQTNLKEQQQQFFTDLSNELNSRLKLMDSAIQSNRQGYLELAADVKYQLQASELAKRYQAFEQTILQHEERFEGLQRQYTEIGAKLKDQVAKSENLQTNVADQLSGLDHSLALMRVSIGQEITYARQSLDTWCAQRREVLDQSYTNATAAAAQIEDKLIQAQTSLQLTVESRKSYEEQIQKNLTEFQNEFYSKFGQWTAEQSDYLIRRNAELAGDTTRIGAQVKEQIKRVDHLMSEEVIGEFVANIEKRVKQVQDEWAQRRVQDFTNRFEEFDRQTTTLQKFIMAQQEKHTEWINTLDTTLNKKQSQALHRIENDVHSQTKGILATCEGQLASAIKTLTSLTNKIHILEEHYTKLTNEAIAAEKYQEYQKTIEKQLTSWFSDKNTQIFTKIYDLTKEANVVLGASKEQQETLTRLYNDSTLQAHIKQVEKNVLKTNDDWRLTQIRNMNTTFAELKTKLTEYTDTINTEQKAAIQKFMVEVEGRVIKANKEWIAEQLRKIPKKVMKDIPVQNTWYSGLTKCFYTAIIGIPGKQCDTLGRVSQIPGWDYICFTNQETPDSFGWKIVRVEYNGTEPALESKYYKWMSHKWLSDYDVTVWLDGYITPKLQKADTFEQWITTMYANQKLILHRPHADRNCIWDECDAVVKYKRDTAENVEKVRSLLTNSKMPHNWGLFDTNIIIKFQKNLELQDICSSIYTQLQTASVRDQLAVTHVYYKEKFNKYDTKSLESVCIKSGNHVRINV